MLKCSFWKLLMTCNQATEKNLITKTFKIEPSHTWKMPYTLKSFWIIIWQKFLFHLALREPLKSFEPPFPLLYCTNLLYETTRECHLVLMKIYFILNYVGSIPFSPYLTGLPILILKQDLKFTSRSLHSVKYLDKKRVDYWYKFWNLNRHGKNKI